MADENLEGLEGLDDFGDDFGDQLDSFMEGDEDEGDSELDSFFEDLSTIDDLEMKEDGGSEPEATPEEAPAEDAEPEAALKQKPNLKQQKKPRKPQRRRRTAPAAEEKPAEKKKEEKKAAKPKKKKIRTSETDPDSRADYQRDRHGAWRHNSWNPLFSEHA